MDIHSISPAALLLVYGVLVALAALAGGWTLLSVRFDHARLQAAISLVAGLMMGMALLHFLPHAAEQLQSLHRCVLWVLGGFLSMFFLQRFIPYHHHETHLETKAALAEQTFKQRPHHHEHGHAHGDAHGHAHAYSWVATAIGMSLHSLIGGVALAAAVVSEEHMSGGLLVGLGTALATILHKPFDSMAIVTLMQAEGCSKRARHFTNGAFALVTPLGMLLFYLGASHVADHNPVVLGAALAFCAGTFLCIACADLLPELQFHTHDRLKLSFALLAGLGIAILIGHLGEGHSHGAHEPAPQVESPDHDHDHDPGHAH